MALVMLLLSCTGTEKIQEDTVLVQPEDTYVEEQQEETAVSEPESEPEPQPDPEEPIEEWDSLNNIQLLTRLSLDLRAIRPSIEEMDRIEADPEQLEVLIEEYLTDPRFGDRIRVMYDDIYHTDTRVFYIEVQNLAPPDSGFDNTRMIISVGEEPFCSCSSSFRERGPDNGSRFRGRFELSNSGCPWGRAFILPGFGSRLFVE